MKAIHPTVVDLQARMFAERLKIAEVMRQADLRPSTWWRWTQGAEPKISSVEKVRQAIEAAVQARAA